MSKSNAAKSNRNRKMSTCFEREGGNCTTDTDTDPEEDEDETSSITPSEKKYENQKPGVLARHAAILMRPDLPANKAQGSLPVPISALQQPQALPENCREKLMLTNNNNNNKKGKSITRRRSIKNKSKNNARNRVENPSTNKRQRMSRSPAPASLESSALAPNLKPNKNEENLLKVRTAWPGLPEKLLTVMRITEAEDDTLFSALAAYKYRFKWPAEENSNLNSATIPGKDCGCQVRGGKRKNTNGTVETDRLDMKVIRESAVQIRKEMVEFIVGFGVGFGSNSDLNYRHNNSNGCAQQAHAQCGKMTNLSLWSKYCHYIYVQHQKALSELRECDFNTRDESLRKSIHSHGKRVYGKFLLDPRTSGSILELAFASIKYGFNAIVVQFISDKSQFYIYNINPQNRNKLYMLNVGRPESGKWRLLSFLPELSSLPWKNPQSYIDNCTKNSHHQIPFAFLQTGVYETEASVPEKTILEIGQIEMSASFRKVDQQQRDAECTLQLFNRLLVGAAKLNEFTFRMAHFNEAQSLEMTSQINLFNQLAPNNNNDNNNNNNNSMALSTQRSCRSRSHSPDSSRSMAHTLSDDENPIVSACPSQNNVNNNNNTKFILAPRTLETKSFHAFKSLENIEDCKAWCESLTGKNQPKLVDLNFNNRNNNNYYDLGQLTETNRNNNASETFSKAQHLEFTHRNQPREFMNLTSKSRNSNFNEIQQKIQNGNLNQKNLMLNDNSNQRIFPASSVLSSPFSFVPIEKTTANLQPGAGAGKCQTQNVQYCENDILQNLNKNSAGDLKNEYANLEYVDLPQNFEFEIENEHGNLSPASSAPVQSALIMDDRFGAPQIVLRFPSHGKFLQEAKYRLFLCPLYSQKIHFRLLSDITGEYGTIEIKNEEFIVEEGRTFYLFNPSQTQVDVRCAWFTTS